MMIKEVHNVTEIADLVCELTRSCTIKEEYFSASFGLSPTEVKVLKSFTNSNSITIKELSTKLKITPGRITHIISSLEQKKLISRKSDLLDKRNVVLAVTSRGIPLINNLNESYIELHKKILDRLGDDEQEKISESLRTLLEVFQEWNENK